MYVLALSYFLSSLKCKHFIAILRLPVLQWLSLFSRPPLVYMKAAILFLLAPGWTTPLHAGSFGFIGIVVHTDQIM